MERQENQATLREATTPGLANRHQGTSGFFRGGWAGPCGKECAIVAHQLFAGRQIDHPVAGTEHQDMDGLFRRRGLPSVANENASCCSCRLFGVVSCGIFSVERGQERLRANRLQAQRPAAQRLFFSLQGVRECRFLN